MSNETELKPCSHCGKIEWLITSAMGEVWGYCNKKTSNGCGLVVHGKHNTMESVVDAINSRPIEDDLNAEIERLVAIIDGRESKYCQCSKCTGLPDLEAIYKETPNEQ
jgi:hypothetical protein